MDNSKVEKGIHLIIDRYPQYLILPMMLWNVHKHSALLMLVCFFLFFRNPNRVSDSKDDDVTSPADGRIMKVTNDGKHITIATFLSVFDVHVQYSPTHGKIHKQYYVKGKFNPAYMLEKSEYNERLRTDIMTRRGSIITVIQIAGQIARRIDSFVKQGETVERGCRLGMIRFGSRVDIVVPVSEYRLNDGIRTGMYIWGGETILCKRV